MKDMAYLTGMVFSTFLDHKLRSVDKKKTKEEIINQLVFFLWRRN